MNYGLRLRGGCILSDRAHRLTPDCPPWGFERDQYIYEESLGRIAALKRIDAEYPDNFAYMAGYRQIGEEEEARKMRMCLTAIAVGVPCADPRKPALSPDNDYEDTLARFSGLHVGIPPYPGYEGRPVVEDFAEPVRTHTRENSHAIAITAFVFGLAVGSIIGGIV
jgi:hypothetical protein